MYEKLRFHYGREPVHLPGSHDGNCLFHALSHALGGYVSHAELRAAACGVLSLPSFVRRFQPFLEADWDGYVRRMRRSGEWGDAFVILALARLLGCHITVVSGGYSQNFKAPRAQRRIFLAYEGNHYEPTRLRA